MRKEAFGPVVVIDAFKSEEEVLKKVNDTEYRLSALVYTKDLDCVVRVVGKLEAGTMTVNNVVHPTNCLGILRVRTFCCHSWYLGLWKVEMGVE